MSVNTIVIPGGSTSVSGTTLDISALYGAVQFIPAVGDELVLKNITFSSAYSSHDYDNVTDIESIMAFTDNQDTYDIYIENITFTEAMYNAMSSAEGLSLKVTDISPDLVYEGWLALKAELVSLPEKTVGLDGVRFLRDKIKAKQDTLTAGSNITISSGTISATDTTYSNFTGATSSVAGAAGLVPAPAAGDEAKALHGDGTWKDTTAKLVEMSYGEASAWTKFINAYNAGSIVYCRASSNANPATGSQTRKAFMAYVNNATSPTSVEFQYVRSVSSKTEAQPVDQVFVYTLTNTNGGTWSVASRNMGPKIAAGTGINVSYSNGTYTISLA